MEYVIVLVILAMIGWHYYNKKLDAETRKALENQVKADIKEVKADVADVIVTAQEEVKKRTPRKKKTDNG